VLAKFRAIKNSLLGGEISPTALGRTDLPSYTHSCTTMKNMIPYFAGGAHRRPGTIHQDFEYFDSGVSTNYAAPVLFPFVAANGAEYIIECVPMRAGGTTGLIWAFSSQQETQAEVFAPSSKYPIVVLKNGVATNFVWTRADLLNARYLQIGDILHIVTPNRQPMEIRFILPYPTTQFLAYPYSFEEFTGVAARDAVPYLAQNLTAETFTASAVAGSITVTMSDKVFLAGDVGTLIKVDIAGARGVVRITSVPIPAGPPDFTPAVQKFTADVVVNLGGVGPVATWWAPAWSNGRGWPGTIEAFQSRIGYGGSALLPDSIWWTKASNFAVLSEETVLNPEVNPAGAEAFTATLQAGTRARIVWMKSARTLLVGTHQSEWTLSVPDETSPFSLTNVSAARQSEYGSNGLIAYTGNEIFFVSRDGSTVKSLAFSFYDQSFVAEEVQNLYDEFPGPPPNNYYVATQATREITQLVWDQTRQTLWCIDNAGNWKGLTRNKKTNISLWHSHELGGYNSSSVPALGTIDADQPVSQLVCDGAVVSVAVILDKMTNRDNLWMVVRRVNGINFVWSVETMRGNNVYSPTAYSQIIASQSIFTDASVVYQASVTPTYAMAHLGGRFVQATANSEANGMFTLSQGQVLFGVVQDTDMDWSDLPDYPGLPSNEYWLAFGFAYASIIETVPVEAGSQIGSAQSAMKRITKSFVHFYKTLSAFVGPSAPGLQSQLEEVQFRTGGVPMNKSAELFSGSKEVLLQSDYVRDGTVYIEQRQPLPFSIVSIVMEGLSND